MTAVVGTVERRGDRRFNSALVVGPNGYLATYDKMWLPGGEREYFEPGETLPVLDAQGWRFAVGICADLQRGDYFRLAADAGAEFFLLCVAGSGMPELVGPDGDQTKQAEAHRALHVKLMRRWSAQSGLYIFYANQAGKSGIELVSGAGARHRSARPASCRALADRGDGRHRGIAGRAGSCLPYRAGRGWYRRWAGELGGRGGRPVRAVPGTPARRRSGQDICERMPP